MHQITIEHQNSHNFIVMVDGVSAVLSYRNFGGRAAVDALGEEGLTQLIDAAEKVILAQDFSNGCQQIFRSIGVSNAMELLRVCCGDAFREYWKVLLFRRKAIGRGYSFRSMLKAISGTKATLAQNDSPFVEELRELCRRVQQGMVDVPTAYLPVEEICDENICVSFSFQVNNSLVFSVNGKDVSLCTRQIGDIKTPADVLHAAQVLRRAVFDRKDIWQHIRHWGGSFVFRVLYAVCEEETVSYFRDYAQRQLEMRTLLDPRRTLKALRFPFNDRSLSAFCHKILSALEQHRFAGGTVLANGNLHAIRASQKSWTLYYLNNLNTHYRRFDFSDIEHPALREEAVQFLQSLSAANGNVDVQHLSRYFYLVRSGLNALAHTNITSIRDVALQHVRLLKSHLDRSQRYSPNHIAEVLWTLGRMYHWASPQCAADENPFWNASIPNKGAFLQTTPPAKDVALRLIAEHLDEVPECVEIGHRLLMLEGSRARDAFHVRVSDLEFTDDGSGYLRFCSGKNHRRMRFLIPVSLAERLKDYIAKAEDLRERAGEDYLLLYVPNGRRGDSACRPALLTYDTYNYYIRKLFDHYDSDHTVTTRRIRAEVGRRYHSDGMTSADVSISLGNTPTVAARHYRTLSHRDEAEVYHRVYEAFIASPKPLESETVAPHPMWGSCSSPDCRHRRPCHECPYLYAMEVNNYAAYAKSS